VGDIRKCILVVDDDSAVRQSLKFALETEGLAVEIYASGRHLLESRAIADAHCLVLDCEMPGMDGFAVVEELAARHVLVPIILMTAPVTDAIRRRAREAGVFRVLEKPLLESSLEESIRCATAL